MYIIHMLYMIFVWIYEEEGAGREPVGGEDGGNLHFMLRNDEYMCLINKWYSILSEGVWMWYYLVRVLGKVKACT